MSGVARHPTSPSRLREFGSTWRHALRFRYRTRVGCWHPGSDAASNAEEDAALAARCTSSHWTWHERTAAACQRQQVNDAHRTDEVLRLLAPLRPVAGLLVLPEEPFLPSPAGLPPCRLPAAPPTNPVAPGFGSAGQPRHCCHLPMGQPSFVKRPSCLCFGCAESSAVPTSLNGVAAPAATLFHCAITSRAATTAAEGAAQDQNTPGFTPTPPKATSPGAAGKLARAWPRPSRRPARRVSASCAWIACTTESVWHLVQSQPLTQENLLNLISVLVLHHWHDVFDTGRFVYRGSIGLTFCTRSANSSPPLVATGVSSAASADAANASFFLLEAGTFGTNLPCGACRICPAANHRIARKMIIELPRGQLLCDGRLLAACAWGQACLCRLCRCAACCAAGLARASRRAAAAGAAAAGGIHAQRACAAPCGLATVSQV